MALLSLLPPLAWTILLISPVATSCSLKMKGRKMTKLMMPRTALIQLKGEIVIRGQQLINIIKAPYVF